MSIEATLDERGRTHGDYGAQARVAQFLKQILRASPRWPDLSLPQKESAELICMKLSRIVHGNPDEPDHWQDIAGYAQLIVRELENEKRD
jgi:hypothetical protein